MMLRTQTVLRLFLIAAAIGVAGLPRIAQAQTAAGVRAGVSANPDQAYFGGHIETAPLFDRVRFRPNVEIGLGDDVTSTTLNLEGIYAFRPSRQGWHAYAGGGPAVNFYRSHGNSDTTSGLNFLFGVERRDGLFFEAKLGAFDSPDFKFGIGYTFR